MTREQYLKIIEREIHNINKRIDLKILHGEEYKKEALEHKQLLRKIRQHSRKSILSNIFTIFPQLSHF